MALGAAKVWGTDVTEEGVRDRAYRLHHSPGQNRCDRLAGGTGAAAAVLAAGLGGGATGAAAGAALGAAAGVLGHVATAGAGVGDAPGRMVEELKARGE